MKGISIDIAGNGLVAIAAAIYSGVRFISTQVDPYSLAMAIAFIVALLAYVGELYTARNQA